MLRPKAERRLRTAPWMLHTLLEALAAQPDVALCTQGLHFPAPDMFTLA